MNIDLHIHSKNGSDGRWYVEDIFEEADQRSIGLISITDHDSLAAQDKARELARAYGMRYLTGIELHVTFSHPAYHDGKGMPLDFLGYGFDIRNHTLVRKLEELRRYRVLRAAKILQNLNAEFREQGIPELTDEDMEAIEASADGSLARPHIAGYLIRKGIVSDKQDAFDRFLVKCDVPKMPLGLEEASELIRGAGGRLVLAHGGDPKGTSLIALNPDITRHPTIIRETMLEHIDGMECWHIRHNRITTKTYAAFTQEEGLIATGGSDCHQNPPILGSMQIPGWVADQFD
jgi:3',5'-nucleoside bisphosphate phosphatase